MDSKIFPGTEHNGHLFVSDYTNYAETHPEYAGISVKYHDSPAAEIGSLQLINNNGIRFKAISFEQCASLFKDSSGKLVKQCEGMCHALTRKDKPGWVLVIELKYCLEKNIGTNIDDATYQLRTTTETLCDKYPGIFHPKDKLYWVASIPDHSEYEPFQSWIHTQDDLIELQDRYNVVLFFRCNTIEILTAMHLRAITA